MRTFELLLLLADLALFAALAFRRIRGTRWVRYLALLAAAVAGAQIALEGVRWQMVPAYALTGLLALAALLGRTRPPETSRHLLHRVVSGLAVSVGALALAIAAFLPVAIPVFHFPTPRGPFGIGTLTYHWVDTNRAEIYTADPGDRRELMVQIWYPAEPGQSGDRARYLDESATLAPLARLLRLPEFFFDHLKFVETNAVPNPPAAGGAARFPVLIFSHGRGGYRQHITFLIEELVSHGYIVAAIDHPYAAAAVAFPDGRVVEFDPRMVERKFVGAMIPFLAEDAIFTLDRLVALDRSDENGILTGRLDLQHAGIFGVSLGGEVGAEACRLDLRLRACLIMDVWMPPDVVASGLHQPAMWISRDAATMRLEGWTEADIAETQDTMRKVFEGLTGDGYFVREPGMFHTDFSDASLLSPFSAWLGFTGPIDPERARRLISDFSLAFFERHLKGASADLLDRPSQSYAEVLFETRRH